MEAPVALTRRCVVSQRKVHNVSLFCAIRADWDADLDADLYEVLYAAFDALSMRLSMHFRYTFDTNRQLIFKNSIAHDRRIQNG
jgi:hypothetical protein